MATASNAVAVSESDLLTTAAKLAPTLRANRQRAERLRRLPDENITALRESGLLLASLPKRFGGYELPFGAHTNIALELGRACPATAWVAGILASHNWWLGKYHPEAQQEIWADGPGAIVAAAFACKAGGIRALPGGDYQVDGEWMYCSGIDHCDWAIVVGPLQTATGPDQGMALLRRSEYEIKDVWQSPGLSGTGSNNVVVNNTTLPSHRVIRLGEINKTESPGAALNPGPCYRLPTLQVFAYSVAAPVIGMAAGTVADFVQSMAHRNEVMSEKKIAGVVTMQMRVSESSADVDAAAALYRSDIEHLRTRAAAGEELTALDTARVQRNSAYVANLCKRATSRLVEVLGAGGLDVSHPVHRGHQDVLAGSAHKALAWDFLMPNYGNALFKAAAREAISRTDGDGRSSHPG